MGGGKQVTWLMFKKKAPTACSSGSASRGNACQPPAHISTPVKPSMGRQADARERTTYVRLRAR
eukprot:15478292-Alexandrium_andersonii.AAC.1